MSLKSIVVTSLIIISLAILARFQQSYSIIRTSFKPSTMPDISKSTSSSLFDTTKPKTPVYFFSHGGPGFMYKDEEPKAWEVVKQIGKTIKYQIKPKFIIVVSAHWESSQFDTVEIATTKSPFNDLTNEIIYDFYGFPSHMYKEQFKSKVNLELINDIKETLQSNGINSKVTPRGIDHGVWVPLKVAFSTNKQPDEELDVDVPLVQVSLKNTDDFTTHRELGQVLARYRELGGLIICSGMSVHNLRDIRMAMTLKKTMPYVSKFSKLLNNGLLGFNGDERFENFQNLKTKHKTLLYEAHPTLEHFIPLVVASGASENDSVKEIYTGEALSLAYGIYQFGEYNK